MVGTPVGTCKGCSSKDIFFSLFNRVWKAHKLVSVHHLSFQPSYTILACFLPCIMA